ESIAAPAQPPIQTCLHISGSRAKVRLHRRTEITASLGPRFSSSGAISTSAQIWVPSNARRPITNSSVLTSALGKEDLGRSKFPAKDNTAITAVPLTNTQNHLGSLWSNSMNSMAPKADGLRVAAAGNSILAAPSSRDLQ